MREAARWRRDATVGGIAGLIALGAVLVSREFLTQFAMDPESFMGAAVAACALALVPGVAIANTIGVVSGAFSGILPTWVQKLLLVSANVVAYAGSWVLLRRGSRALKVSVVMFWVGWLALAWFFASARS